MKKMFLMSALLTLLALTLAACGAQPAPVAESASPVNIKLETDPNPAAVGKVTLSFTVTDESGNPIEGATVDVNAEHPSMAGMGMSGQATEQGGGKYAITAEFSDKGTWKITFYVRKDKLDAKQETDLEVK
jgi:ABC-type glycerol-3-phosphate transport system substrate-binding protein